MQRFQQVELKKRKIPAPLMALFLIVLLFILLSSVLQLVRKQVQLHKSIKQLKAERAALVQKEQTLAATVTYLETPEGKEQALRDKYRMVSPGEGVVIITDPPELESKENEQKKNFIQRFFRAVKDVFSGE